MPILLAPMGKPLTIVRLSGDKKTIQHLRTLGLAEEGSVEVLSNEGGAVVVKVLDSRLALDRNIARGIFVA